MDIDVAVYRAVHDYQAGVDKLAALLGMSASSLQKKANPNYAGAHLSPMELLQLCEVAGLRPWVAGSARLGQMLLPMPDLPGASAGGETVTALTGTVRDFSAFITEISADLVDDDINDNELSRIESKALASIEATHRLVALARNKNRAGKARPTAGPVE